MIYRKKLYQDALDVQNACNASGVIGSLARVMPEIMEELVLTGDASTEARNRHPVVLCYLSKLVDLAGGEFYPEAAFSICEERAKGWVKCAYCGATGDPDVIERRECCPKHKG